MKPDKQVADDLWEVETSALERSVAQCTILQTCLKQLPPKLQHCNISCTHGSDVINVYKKVRTYR
jgi:hypothetical protein